MNNDKAFDTFVASLTEDEDAWRLVPIPQRTWDYDVADAFYNLYDELLTDNPDLTWPAYLDAVRTFMAEEEPPNPAATPDAR